MSHKHTSHKFFLVFKDHLCRKANGPVYPCLCMLISLVILFIISLFAFAVPCNQHYLLPEIETKYDIVLLWKTSLVLLGLDGPGIT